MDLKRLSLIYLQIFCNWAGVFANGCWFLIPPDLKECVKYLLIFRRRGVEISQRHGERWSRSIQIFSIYAFLSLHLTRLSPSRQMSLNMRWSLSTIFTGMSVATNPPLHLDAKSTTTELIVSELSQSRQCNSTPLGEVTTPNWLVGVVIDTSLNPLFISSLVAKK